MKPEAVAAFRAELASKREQKQVKIPERTKVVSHGPALLDSSHDVKKGCKVVARSVNSTSVGTDAEGKCHAKNNN